MNSSVRDRWPEVRALFEAALARPRAERGAWVAQGAGDDALRDAVLALLADAGDDTLGDDAPAASPGDADAPAGEAIGRYRVERILGRGGMGVVYLAAQESPRRQVAIKRLAGAAGGAALARFHREADLLARLSHPGIARIIEVDADAGGRPFIAMEFVDGIGLAAFSAGRSRPERIALLARIADAVEHAHARGVVHRDLKPSNILVCADGQPKVLDFGIGLLQDDAHTLTETGVLLGTPAYMSPEQAAGRGKVDARSDVYALGVIAYELLADRLPLPVAGLTPLEALRVVGESTPPPLSRIDRTLGGDLEIVVETALAKEPSRRYASAGAFADDLRRFLAREPIRARRPGALRRMLLLARRRPAQVAAVAIAVVGVLGGAALAFHAALAERRERDRAEAALAQAEDAMQALSRVFAAGNPAIAGRPEVAFREVLAAAPAQLEGLPAPARLRVLYTIALARAQIGDQRAAAAGFADAARLADTLGEDRAWAQATLRELMSALPELENGVAARRLDALLADPRIMRSPRIRAGLALQAAAVASSQLRLRSSDRLRAEAEAAWRDAAAEPPPIDDPTLADEIEIDLLVWQFGAVVQGEAGAPEPAAYLRGVQAARDRLEARFVPDHPHRATLSLIADALPDALAGRPAWRKQLLAELDAQVPRLGITHPAVLARIQTGHALLSVMQLDDQALRRYRIEAMRAMPADSRLRLRYLLYAIGASPGAQARGIGAAEVLATRAPLCPADGTPDQECVWSALIAAQLQLAEGEVDTAVAGLAAVSADLDALPPAFVHQVSTGVAFTLQALGRTAQATDAAERAIAAVLADPEMTEPARDIQLMQTAWALRPSRCDRVLELIGPRERRLATYPQVGGDVLARLLSTCEVRAGRDPAAALARLAPWWARAADPAVDPLIRVEVVNAHLEIFDVLGRDADFARWAGELETIERSGQDLSLLLSRRMPWVERARRLHGRDPPPAPRG